VRACALLPGAAGPAPGMTPQTINDIFFGIVQRGSPRVMLQRQATGWAPVSAQELYRGVAGVARALRSWGIRPGDRIAILSENRPEWAIADFATMLIGAVVVPIYPTLTPEQAAVILRDSGTRVTFVSTRLQFDKIDSIAANTPLERIVVMDHVESGRAALMSPLLRSGPDGRDEELERIAAAVQPGDLATLIYTSGTTGVPKGVMLTHGNLTSNVLFSLAGFPFEERATSVSFLPLSHITARHVDYALLYRGVTLAYCPFIEHLAQALLEVRPEFFIGVPRVYEKIRRQVEQSARSGWKRQVLRWALATGRTQQPVILRGELPSGWPWRVANRLVFTKIRAGMGGRVKIHISGGAPLGRDLARWYADAGIRIHEGYGLTETSPVIAVNTPDAHRLGSVGRPLANVEVRLAEDGEILVRGPSVFRSYWNRPEETRAAFVAGFFKTGDVGEIDADGFLYVTDRKKDLIKTSGGKYIAPQPIENALKSNVLVAEAVVIGDKRKFAAVILAPYFPLLEDWAGQNQVACNSREGLIANPKIRALYEGIVEDVNKNLARFEQLKKVILTAEEFSAATGVLTPTLKLRRRAAEEKFLAQIEEMYALAEQSRESRQP
jgi:long-chain acyl-CoA synthetase